MTRLKLWLLGLVIVAVVGIPVFNRLHWLYDTPRIVPIPYSFIIVTIDDQPLPDGGTEHIETYDIDRSVNDVQGDYEATLKDYCQEKVEFKQSTNCKNGGTCSVMKCNIPWPMVTSPSRGQWLEIQLYPKAKKLTSVVQINTWTR